MKSWSALALVLFVSVGLGQAAEAAPPAPADATKREVTPEAKAEARERFDRGLGLFEKGENAAALAEFKRAYELIPNPVVLYNMGLVYAAMNRPVEATDTLDRYLSQAADKASPEQRKHATKVRDEQAARVAGVMVVTDHPATVELDGVEAGRTPMTAPLRLPSGAHTIAVMAPGYQPTRRELTLAGKVTETITLTLLPTESGAAHLVISTPLPGAAVWINDKLVGSTPLPASVAVTPGDVRVELKRDGYRPTSRLLRVDQGATAKVELIMEEDPAAPAATKGTLRLTMVESASTEVSLDGVARPMAGDGIVLPVGPHALRVQSAGFEPFATGVQLEAGRTTTLAVNLVPTLDTRARDEQAIHGRRVLGGTILGAGLAVAAGAAVYVIVSHNDVSSAQSTLGAQLMNESNPLDPCYFGAARTPGVYENRNCAAVKSYDQDQVDSAKLKRVLGYSAIGLGAIAAGVGGYLLATAGSVHAPAVARTRLDLWAAGQGTGLSLSGAF